MPESAAAPLSPGGTATRSTAAEHLRLLLRAPPLILLIAYGLILALLVRLDPSRRLQRERLGSHWSRLLLRLLGICYQAENAPGSDAVLIVANHVSWLDIPLISACVPTRFVSKSEVQHWPVAGWLADAAGTFYLRRGKGGSGPLLRHLVPYLRGQAASVTVFPEGTTTDGRTIRPFHPRLFAAAVESGCAVQPVALRYGPGTDGTHLAPFIGDDDLLSHLLRLLRNRQLSARIVFGPPLCSRDMSREALADAASASIRLALA